MPEAAPCAVPQGMIYLTLFLIMMRKLHSSFGYSLTRLLNGIEEEGLMIEPPLKARKGYFMS